MHSAAQGPQESVLLPQTGLAWAHIKTLFKSKPIEDMGEIL